MEITLRALRRVKTENGFMVPLRIDAHAVQEAPEATSLANTIPLQAVLAWLPNLQEAIWILRKEFDADINDHWLSGRMIGNGGLNGTTA